VSNNVYFCFVIPSFIYLQHIYLFLIDIRIMWQDHILRAALLLAT